MLSGHRRFLLIIPPLSFSNDFDVRVERFPALRERSEHYPTFGDAFASALIFYAVGNLFPRTWIFYRKRRFANGMTRVGRKVVELIFADPQGGRRFVVLASGFCWESPIGVFGVRI